MSTPATVDISKWYQQAFTPTYDGEYPGSERPTGSGGYSDADYPAIPTYVEEGLFFDSAATGANDGSSWTDAYTDEETAVAALAGLANDGPALALTCRGTFSVPSGGVSMNKYGGAGDADNWRKLRADPVNGCNLTSLGGYRDAFFFGGQSYWMLYGFTITGGTMLFAYSNGDSSFGGIDHITIRDMDGTFESSNGSDNSCPFYFANDSDWVGIFDCDIGGEGEALGVGNCASVWLDQVEHFRIENNVLHDAPRGFYFKHHDILHIDIDNRWFRNNYVYGNRVLSGGIMSSGSYINIVNNIVADAKVYLNDGGGGDDGSDSNFLDHNTFMNEVHLVDADSMANDNTLTNTIMGAGTVSLRIIPWQTIVASTNITNYNLYSIDGIVYQDWGLRTLSYWQANSVPAAQDINSLAGLPTFVGGATPTTIAGFELASGSRGEDAASDGSDMGADVSLVGPK